MIERIITVGKDKTEVPDVKPAEFLVSVIKREKRACAKCRKNGVQTHGIHVQIEPA
ncbi:hypothetical protein ACOBR2_09835 [Telmatobacter bradus]|uniref:hypothetical protein n=1 Tax=Telmatobacter bradus TaxID=474953 RepID=UPI003B43948F